MTVELARAPYALLRALAATVLVMSGAVVAHTWAGGHLPGLLELLLLTGVVLAAGLLTLRGVASMPVLLGVVAAAQAGLHGLFSALAAPGAHAAHAAHAGHSAVVEAAAGADPSIWSWQMLAAHAAGTLLAALAFWVCDRALVAVVVLAARVRLAVLPGSRRPSPVRIRTRPSLHHLVVAPRRGPPVAA